jgi:acetyl esterase/lipase
MENEGVRPILRHRPASESRSAVPSAAVFGQKGTVSPFWNLIRGIRPAVSLRRKVKGPLRPSWDPTFETVAELFHQGSRRIIRLPIEAQRRSTSAVVLGLPSSPLYKETVFEKVVAGGVPAEWFRREDAALGPVILYLHGGGYGLGSIDTHRDLVARICRAAAGSALSLEYRLAPEHRFPAQVEDATNAYRWLLQQDVPPRRIVIAGDSAGGGLTLSTLVSLRDSGLPAPAAAVCLSPWVDLEALGTTVDENDRYDYISRRALVPKAIRRRRRRAASSRRSSLRGPARTAARAHPGRLRRDAARRFAPHGGQAAKRPRGRHAPRLGRHDPRLAALRLHDPPGRGCHRRDRFVRARARPEILSAGWGMGGIPHSNRSCPARAHPRKQASVLA